MRGLIISVILIIAGLALAFFGYQQITLWSYALATIHIELAQSLVALGLGIFTVGVFLIVLRH